MMFSVPPASASAEVEACEGALLSMRGVLAKLDDFDSDRDLADIQTKLDALTEFFVASGYSEYFASRHITSLLYTGAKFNLRLYDKRSPEFRKLLVASKINIDDHLGSHVGGLFFTPRDGSGRLQFIIAIDPSTKDPPFEDAVFEEILHARFQEFLLKHFAISRTQKVPYAFTASQNSLHEMISELFVKDTLRYWGKGLDRDFTADLGHIMSYVERTPEDVPGFAQLMGTVVGCANRAGIPWRELSLYRYLRCVIAVKDKEDFEALYNSATQEQRTDIFRAAYRANQRQFPRDGSR